MKQVSQGDTSKAAFPNPQCSWDFAGLHRSITVVIGNHLCTLHKFS